MKVSVRDLRPNPFREIGKYPIDKAKVESLKLSIKETSFWDNVLCRRKGGVFEIAYGHHRLQALKELKIKQVDIPCRKLTDAQMVRIMAEENLEWLTSPAVINQTVMTVKKFLDAELAKYETFNELKMADKSISHLFDNQKAFINAKREDQGLVGRSTIRKFLGDNWKRKEWMIQSALKTEELAKAGKLDRKAVEVFDKVGYVEQFEKAVEQYDVPVEKQKKIAEKVRANIAKKVTATQGRVTQCGRVRMSIAEDVRTQAGEPKSKKAKSNEVERIINALDGIEKQSRTLADKLECLRMDIKRLGIEQMNGLKPALTKFALYRLTKELEIWKGFKNGKSNSRNRRISSNAV